MRVEASTLHLSGDRCLVRPSVLTISSDLVPVVATAVNAMAETAMPGPGAGEWEIAAGQTELLFAGGLSGVIDRCSKGEALRLGGESVPSDSIVDIPMGTHEGRRSLGSAFDLFMALAEGVRAQGRSGLGAEETIAIEVLRKIHWQAKVAHDFASRASRVWFPTQDRVPNHVLAHMPEEMSLSRVAGDIGGVSLRGEPGTLVTAIVDVDDKPFIDAVALPGAFYFAPVRK